ncbi:hypothetical protein [Metamycoplasma equirhinis]|uniref:hypothetical protein n=1 Tax=Metamycoplasma equirhinis TaxID=92402 RepID=UPI003592F1E9
MKKQNKQLLIELRNLEQKCKNDKKIIEQINKTLNIRQIQEPKNAYLKSLLENFSINSNSEDFFDKLKTKLEKSEFFDYTEIDFLKNMISQIELEPKMPNANELFELNSEAKEIYNKINSK